MVTLTHITLASANHMAVLTDKGGTAKSTIKGHGSKKGIESLKAIAVPVK